MTARFPNPFKSLRGWFFLTTACAIAAGISVQIGPHWLPPLIALPLCFAAGWWQIEIPDPNRKWLFIVGGTLYIVSMILPTYRVFDTMLGFETLLSAFMIAANIFPSDGNEWLALPLYLGVCLANILFVTSPYWYGEDKRKRPAIIDLFAATTVTVWSFGPMSVNPLIGYYVWATSFLLLLLAMGVQRSTLRWMGAALAIVIVALVAHTSR